MDLYVIGLEMQYINKALEEIRILSKGDTKDFRHAPYNDDINLLKYILSEKIVEMRNKL